MRTFVAEKTPQCTFTSIRPRNTCGTSRNACPNSSTGKARSCTRDATRSKPSRRRALGVDSPEPVAWSEYRRRGLLCDSYYVSRRSDYTPLSQTTARFPAAGTLPVLEAFARFTVQLHEKGIEHRDFNHGNILWDRTPAGAYRFQLIDINRMHFDDRPLSSRACMINLRRLSCPAVAFLYILDRYAETRGWDVDDTLLRGTFFRLAFGRRKQLRKRFRHRKG